MTESSSKPASPAGVKAFLIVWLGQMISMIGSGLTRFAVGVWVYEQTGEVTDFTLILVFATLPGMLVSPLAGALVDRWDRRHVMLGCNLGLAAGSLTVLLLLLTDHLELWAIYLAVAFSSIVAALHLPAYIASTTLLVPKAHFGRASGLMQFGQAAAGIVAPPTAGLLMVAAGLRGVLIIDLVTFAFAFTTLVMVRFPRPKKSASGEAAAGSLGKEAAYGWTFIRDRPGLLGLLIYFALVNMVLAMATALVYPLVLAFSTKDVLGKVLAADGLGLLLGSLLMGFTGGPKRRIHGVLATGIIFAFTMACIGLRPNAWVIGISLFAMTLLVPIINGCSQAIWQSKVPPDVQGRVFAVRRMIAQLSQPLAYLAAGPLADHVFEPLLVEGAPLAATFGPIFGVGPGRGLGLLYPLIAIVPIVASLLSYSKREVRLIEDELADEVD